MQIRICVEVSITPKGELALEGNHSDGGARY
jgi:hypothetical protein